MAFDSVRRKVVLFGGNRGIMSYGDTWEWNGTTWQQVATLGPAARSGHSMVYDSARGKAVLYGGLQGGFGGSTYGDTWEWNGDAWREVASTGPSARYGVAMAYDSTRGRTVLFGCYPYDSATWVWDGSDWTQLAASGPGARQSAMMAFDSVRRKTILFGGFYHSDTVSGCLGDTWTWDGHTWQQTATSGPSPRMHSVVAFDLQREKTVLFGGNAGAVPSDLYYGDTWEWDGSQWKQVDTPGPGPRTGAAMAYDIARGQCVLFGGFGGSSTYGDTWVYTLPSIVTPFTLGDAIRSVQWSAGLATLSESDRIRCDVETSGTSAGCVNMLDACRIARKVAGLEPNP